MTSSPLVSILVPLHNKREWIESTLVSALSQTYPNVEVVVIDDGSTDGSADVVASIGDSRLRLIRREQRGANVTRNELLDAAKGEFVQYLDADDLLDPEKIARQVPALVDGADVSLCSVRRPIGSASVLIPPDLASFSFEMLAGSGVPSMSPIHRRRHLVDIGGWTPDLPASQEYDLHLRLAMAGHWRRPHLVREALAEWRAVTGSTSGDDRRVYASKLSVVERVAPQAADSERQVLSRVAVNAGRHLARMGDVRAGAAAIRFGLELDRRGRVEVPARQRWLMNPTAMASAERLEHRIRGRLG